LISGICNPYVPGTIIGGSPDDKAINVLDTWPDGPAEKAGICPGDQIVAVNDVLVAGHAFEQMVREIVSPSPSLITLKVKRGTQEVEFRFMRVRESTLAQLSHEKFIRRRIPFGGKQPVGIVPLDETRDELQELARFYDGIDRRVGFKFMYGMDVPEGTPEEQVKKLAAIRPGGPEESRYVGKTPLLPRAKDPCVPGFRVVLLKNPEEVLVDFISPNSPAQRTGLFPGDQILEVNGRPVAGLDEDQLSDLILKPDEPREIRLKLRREASTVGLKIQTQKIKESEATDPFSWISGYPTPLKPDSYILGLYVSYVENPREAMVDQVDYPSPAFDAGLHVGDRILQIGGVPIEQISVQRLREMLEPKGAAEFRLEVSRLGRKLEVHIKPATYAETEVKIGRKITKSRPMPAHCPEG
jgi:C-terminal processing protease CtpA/Prc